MSSIPDAMMLFKKPIQLIVSHVYPFVVSLNKEVIDKIANNMQKLTLQGEGFLFGRVL